jgi:hypothetical protein
LNPFHVGTLASENVHDPIRAGDFIDGIFDLDIAYKFAARICPNFLHRHTL